MSEKDIIMNHGNGKSLAKGLRPLSDMKEEYIAARQEERGCRTGFVALDAVLDGGLYNELYIMKGNASTGKSDLMISIAQNLAAQEINVLYYSFGMGRGEFVSRGISEISFLEHRKDDKNKLMTTGKILYLAYNSSVREFFKIPYVQQYYEKYMGHLERFDSNSTGFSVRKVAAITKRFIKKHPGEKTVVFVDCLQILTADKRECTAGDRGIIMDTVVRALKRLAAQAGVPVFAAAGTGKDYDPGSISLGSMKESDSIEYSADVLIGYTWLGVDDTEDTKRQKKEKTLCAKRGYREMEFRILKNRDNRTGSSARLFYFPSYSHFEDEYTFHPIKEKAPY